MTDCKTSSNSTSNEMVGPAVVKPMSNRSNNRIRIIRLNRNRFNVTKSFGFSLRGGKEFGTGFFVSHVEKGSEADLRGLKAGDEIYQVNGYKVSDAVHRELGKYIANQDRITLRVRGIGMIPVKEYPSDPLTWQIIGATKQPKTVDNFERIMLTLAPRMKLGCGICKGPDWKPGIFVQFTKENGVARTAGLRPGDQIISCNGIDFTNISFNEAVTLMKQSHTLDLIIRVSQGIDLFPNESSGYNSSASSATGDQSPCWGNENSKRLSIVREESNSSGDRKMNMINNSNGRMIDRRPLKQVPAPKVPPRSKTTQITSSLNPSKPSNNTTIIKLSENGTLINNILISNYDTNSKPSSKQDTTKRLVQGMEAMEVGQKSSEIKTIKVEVHQNANNLNTSSMPPPPPSLPIDLQSTASSVSGISSSSVDNSSSLKCALFEEIKRRAEKKEMDPNQEVKKLEANNSNKRVSGIVSSKQHDALIEEFRLAHKRMFKNGFVENEKDLQQTDSGPAPTPTPDYDSTPQNSLSKFELAQRKVSEIMNDEAKMNRDVAELESLQSFDFENNNNNRQPKFPQQFFIPPCQGPATMKKTNPQVAVKIDEYQNRAEQSSKANAQPIKRALKQDKGLSATPNKSTKTKNKVTIVVPTSSKEAFADMQRN